MVVTIFGTGYVGLVTGACLAEMGNRVVCLDIDADKVASLGRGEIPIYEPGLAPMVKRHHASGQLLFSTEVMPHIAHSHVVFIAVGTPSNAHGGADLGDVLSVARTLGRHLERYTVIVNKSTVPVGTALRVQQTIQQEIMLRGVAVPFDVVSNPEFLKQGDAINDCMRPDRIILGSPSARAIALLRKLYAPFNRSHDRLLVMDAHSAELTKYASNAMLATKISFMNEIANIAERVGADVEQVRLGMGADPRIGFDFIYAGIGYGGSCFPKDVRALEHTAREVGYQARLLGAVETVNRSQKARLFQMLAQYFEGQLEGKIIALWGLAFKPNTNDMREAPSRYLMEALWQAGAVVRAYDPEATSEARRIYGERSDLVLCTEPYEALRGTDALAIVTEWKCFRSPDFNLIANMLKDPVIFDGRNLYDASQVLEAGLNYYSIGRVPALSVEH